MYESHMKESCHLRISHVTYRFSTSQPYNDFPYREHVILHLLLHFICITFTKVYHIYWIVSHLLLHFICITFTKVYHIYWSVSHLLLHFICITFTKVYHIYWSVSYLLLHFICITSYVSHLHCICQVTQSHTHEKHTHETHTHEWHTHECHTHESHTHNTQINLHKQKLGEP